MPKEIHDYSTCDEEKDGPRTIAEIASRTEVFDLSSQLSPQGMETG